MKQIELENLINQMSVKEKILQLVQVHSSLFSLSSSEITGPMKNMNLDEKNLFNIGSCLGIKDAATAKLLQDKNMERNSHRIPMLFMLDVIHGYKTIYPIPLALGCSFDDELVAECSKMAAKEASVSGVHVTFAPMVDYVCDARWGRVMESCGEDPFLNSVMGAAQVKGFQGDDITNPNNIATCVKHFAAYGGGGSGKDYNAVEISERSLRQLHFPAYKACINEGAKLVMPSFNSLNGIPSVANQWLMNDILRNEWSFDGVVISDWAAVSELIVHGVAEDLKDAAKLAFESGCDIEMASNAYVTKLEELIDEGLVSEAKLDEAVMRILKLKNELGLFENPYHGASEEKENKLHLCDEHRKIAENAAIESAVLLKNEGVLPMAKSIKKLALIGPFSDTREIIGSWSLAASPDDAITVKEGIINLLPNVEIKCAQGCGADLKDYATDGFGEAIALAKECDAVIICIGEKQCYSGEGTSRANLRLPGMQVELVNEIIGVNPNSAVVLFTGRPLVLDEINAVAPAILNMWFPGTEGGNAVAKLVFGDANPCGKLSMSFPKSVGQCPLYYNYYSTGRPKVKADDEYEPYVSNYLDCGNLPLFFFGQGLSYTNFSYESMDLSSNVLSENSSVKVSVCMKNTGERKGKETVQLYIRDLVSKTVRPIQELIAFKKIELDVGEREYVEFEIREEMLRYWNFSNEYVSEKGKFEVFVGYANHKILCDIIELV